jgi:hypothetical protein
MLPRMRGVQVFVFVEQSATTDQRFVAVAPVHQLRWALAQRYPWLEVAWVHANLRGLSQAPPNAPKVLMLPDGTPDPCKYVMKSITSDSGAFEPVTAGTIAFNFIDSLQQAVLPPGASQEDWQACQGTTRGYERAQRVTRELLTSLLPQEARDAWANDLRDASRGKRTRAVFRCRRTDFVALTLGDREFSALTNRRALLEDVAALLGEEPESGPG